MYLFIFIYSKIYYTQHILIILKNFLMRILVTGTGGFIGYHLVSNLANNIKNTIIGIDSVNSYYPTKIKKLRIKL